MEPEPITLLWLSAINYGLPFACFFLGILIASGLRLHNGIGLRNCILMGIPVSLVFVSSVLFTAEPAYQSSVLKFLMLSGTVMFYGTLTPQLFVAV